MGEKMECEAAQSHCTQPAGAVCRVRSAGGEIQTVGCAARYARERPERAHQSSVRVRNDREDEDGSEVVFGPYTHTNGIYEIAEVGSERACGAWAITSRDANP